MWIVRLALRRPFTVAVSTILIFLGGFLCVRSMQVDIFPVIDLPVIGVVWNYPGVSALDMERRVTLLSERGISTTVNGVSRIESQSIPGISLLRVYFEPGADVGSALAQISAVSAASLRVMPPGMTPPVLLPFNASNVPVTQLTISSQIIPEEKLFDYGLNFIRIRLFTLPGLSVPAPYGGKNRQINVYTDPVKMQAKELSPIDVVNALNTSNIILPAGDARIGDFDYNVALNASPEQVEDFAKIPLKVVDDKVVTIGDVGRVVDGFADQTNIVRVNGKRATYLNILKKSDASTISIVDSIKDILPLIKQTSPEGMNIKLDFDQSVFVRSAIYSVLREGLIASILVSLMLFLFLGSWRNMIVVCTSIPCAIFVGIIGLKFTGNSINIMTLGGLSLAIGMLVDDATVEVENIHRNRMLGLPLTKAILTGASQIALPAIMATLAICIVFFPVVLITGPAKFLFTPMALSVVISMLASYVLSRTLVPLLARLLLEHENHHAPTKLFERFSKGFDRLQNAYGNMLAKIMGHRRFALSVVGALLMITLPLPFIVGTDFFPTSDTGLMKFHFRAPTGIRIESTELLIEQVEKRIAHIIPKDELDTVNVMIGVPTSYNLAFIPTDNANGMDAEVTVSLKKDHAPTAKYVTQIRADLAKNFPGSSVYFLSPDIVSQILNFGLTSPIDVQIEYTDLDKSLAYAQKLVSRMQAIPGAADVTIKQVLDYPTLKLDVDRIRAARMGISQRDVANSMLISLSSSFMVGPSYYLNPSNNVNYTVVVKTPLEKITSVADLVGTPVVTEGAYPVSDSLSPPADLPMPPGERLSNLADVKTTTAYSFLSHNNVQRVLDVTMNVDGRDLGSVSSALHKEIAKLGELPVGMKITVRGQGEVMNSSFKSLGLGLIIAILLVYLLMVIFFQSWLDPFIVMVAAPGALTGIMWMLLCTGTTINVVSFMGSIMAIGIAASNSILLVSFANDLRIHENLGPIDAALTAGKTRLRPILMTALAMILGMLPAALGLGEGGEQNAPLGRAVIGGLIVATFVTLFVVPVIYSLLRVGPPTKHLLDEKLRTEEAGLHL